MVISFTVYRFNNMQCGPFVGSQNNPINQYELFVQNVKTLRFV